ncbi:hypothetical protein LJR267_009104 [Paraburkholderia hospita]|jgi:hypothetical protein|uniref:hypothetical protein n=1 Tax=Paraburkholderia hospita TaxID=169430 RepID=UPI000B344E7D|nr:hypothetical protein [Paraburkholderia hospita]OUL67899.1 hypothetical protein CA601_52230 [Paraburkholderia hospita]
MKRKHIVLGALFAGSAAILAFTGRTPADEVVEAAPRKHAVPLAVSSGVASSVVTIASLHARGERAGAAGGDRRRALFGALSLAPPLPSAAPAGTDIPPLPTAPPAPDIPFAYLGKQAANGRWEVYLARGDETLIVREQTIIDGTYRIETIAPPTLTLVYLPTRLVQTLDIGSAD